MVRKPVLFPSSGREASNLVGRLDHAIHSHWEPQKE